MRELPEVDPELERLLQSLYTPIVSTQEWLDRLDENLQRALQLVDEIKAERRTMR